MSAMGEAKWSGWTCFFRALADSFRLRDWMFSFFMEIGREVCKERGGEKGLVRWSKLFFSQHGFFDGMLLVRVGSFAKVFFIKRTTDFALLKKSGH